MGNNQHAQPSEEKQRSTESPTTSPISPAESDPPPFTTMSAHHRRKSSVLVVNNGITGTYLSARMCKIAANFYHRNIDTLSVYERLEVGCSVFFGMNEHASVQDIVQYNITAQNKNIEVISLKYLDMMGWLLRNLVTSCIDLYGILTKLGTFHQRMGLQMFHFTPMIIAVDETFSHYFPSKYSVEVKYAFEEIFTLAAHIMTLHAKSPRYLTSISEETPSFLQHVSICMKSPIGKEFFYKYLAQEMCDEIAIFLKSVDKFKHLESNKERYVAAKTVQQLSIKNTAKFCINLSPKTQAQITHQIHVLEKHFTNNHAIKVCNSLFSQAEHETYDRIMNSHWNHFVNEMKRLQSTQYKQ